VNHVTDQSHPPKALPSGQPAVLVALAAAVVACGWVYWPALGVMAHKWATASEYSHGWLVPVFAVGLLWLRRERIPSGQLQASWWGIPLLLLAVGMKLVAAYYYYEWFDLLSFVPCVGGLCLVLGGRGALAWAWPAILFLFFMIPLPHTLEDLLREPLRWLGTRSSEYLMQTIGLPAYAEGFVVFVGEQKIGVEEACSGLNMLMTFFALSTAVAILCERPLWERAVILVSAVPIALIANVARVAIVGILHAFGYHQFAETLHKQAAFLMMPIALGLLGAELWLLSALLIEEKIEPMAAGLEGLTSAAEIPDSPRADAGQNVPVSVRG
jgi:exosortase